MEAPPPELVEEASVRDGVVWVCDLREEPWERSSGSGGRGGPCNLWFHYDLAGAIYYRRKLTQIQGYYVHEQGL